MPRRRKKLPPPITAAEWDVMDVLWQDHPRAAVDVHAALAGRRDWSPKTVKSLLSRLQAKGAVQHERDGNRFLYSPLVSREDCVLAEGRDLFERAKGAVSPMLAFFAEEGDLDADDIAALKAILARRAKEKE